LQLTRWLSMIFALGGVALAATTSSSDGRAAGLPAAFSQRLMAAMAGVDKAELYKSPDSGNLAWGESYVLDAYYWMYEGTGDTAWLDRIVRHADVILGNLSPGDELFPGWRTDRYSVALVDVRADPANPSKAHVKPDPARIFDIDTAHKVSGHDYELRVMAGGSLAITDTTTSQPVATVELPADGHITAIPGVTLVVGGTLEPGDRFVVKTQAPAPLEYTVHDGMILAPIARFCAAVARDASLRERYGAAAQRYLKLMETQLLPKWQPYWRELPDGAGVYIFQDVPAQRFPGASQPHNQYLALGRVYIAVYCATGDPRYRERAEKMARFFKRNLRLVGGHYEWNYWDYAGPWDEQARAMAHTEDTSHGHIDIAFAVDAYDAGIVFDREDMQRFARTITDAMWNGSDELPRVGGRVNSPEGPGIQALDWARLGRFSTKARQIMVRMIETSDNLNGSHSTAAAEVLAMARVDWNPRPNCALAARPRQ